VAATGKPVIVVLFNGRPLTIPEISTNATAILEAWHPGVQGGNGNSRRAVWRCNTCGTADDILSRTMSARCRFITIISTPAARHRRIQGNYVDAPITPLYPFGYGLSYTTFQYGKVQLSASSVKSGETLTAHVPLKKYRLARGEPK